MNDNQNSTETFDVTLNDILMGRRGRDNHPGNKAFRDIVSKYKLLYLLETKTHEEKRNLVELIISEIKAQDPPGRFLHWDCSNHSWCEVDDVGKIHKKVSQALRDGTSSTRRLIRRSSIMSTAVETDPLTHTNSMSSRKGTRNKKVNIQDNDNDRILTQDEDKNQKEVVPDYTVLVPNIARRGNCMQEHVNYSEVKSHCVTMSSIENSHADEVRTNVEEGYDHVSNPFYLTPLPSSFLFVSSVDEDKGPQQYASASDESSSGVNKNKKMKRQNGSEFVKLTPPPQLEVSSLPLSTTTGGLSNSSVAGGGVNDDSTPKMSVVNKERKSRTQIKSTTTTVREDKGLKVVPQELFPSKNLFPCFLVDEKEEQQESEQEQEEEQVFLQEEQLEEEPFISFESNSWWEEEITSHGFDW